MLATVSAALITAVATLIAYGVRLDRTPVTRAAARFAAMGYRVGLSAAIILGTSLQSRVLSFTLPHRSDDRPLYHPTNTALMFIGGSMDGMATPELMEKTVRRYQPPVHFTVIEGANHLGWSQGLGPMDRPDLDRPATIPEEEQIARTLNLITNFIGQARGDD